MIVDCAVYVDGRRSTVDGGIGDALEGARAAGGDAFLWIGLHEPTTAEFAEVSSELQLHSLAIEDAVKAHQRPKLERYGEVLFVVLKTLRYDEATSTIESGELMLFVGGDFVITVRHGRANPLAGVRRRVESDRDLCRHGPGAVLYAVSDSVVDTYTEIADSVGDDLTDLEARVFSPGRSDVVAAIYSLKREVLEFHGAVAPLVPVMRDLLTGRVALPEPIRPFLRDVADHVLRVNGAVDGDNELLTSVLSAHLAQVSVRQNEDMRRISAWVAILAVPTMIAGIYGMNFTHMPALHERYGYLAVLVVMLTVCLVLYRLFRRSGWL